MRQGADWYQREPVAYLGGVQGLTAKEHAVYSVVIDLIYLHGGSVNNDPAWISGWISDMGAHATRKAIQALVEAGKLLIEDGQLTQKRAKTQAKTKENVRETRRKHGKKGGISSGKSRATSSKNNNLGEASGSTREEKRREEIKEEANASCKKRGSRIPDDWLLPKDWGEWATDEGWPEDVVRLEALQFHDYWKSAPGQRGVKLDWKATWRTWMRKVSKSPQLKAINGGRHDRTKFNEAHREYARRVGAGQIDFGPDDSDPFAGG